VNLSTLLAHRLQLVFSIIPGDLLLFLPFSLVLVVVVCSSVPSLGVFSYFGFVEFDVFFLCFLPPPQKVSVRVFILPALLFCPVDFETINLSFARTKGMPRFCCPSVASRKDASFFLEAYPLWPIDSLLVSQIAHPSLV